MRHVDDVKQNVSFFRLLRDLSIDGVFISRCNRDERAFKVATLVLALNPLHAVLADQLSYAVIDLRAYNNYFGVAIKELYDFFLTDITAALCNKLLHLVLPSYVC